MQVLRRLYDYGQQLIEKGILGSYEWTLSPIPFGLEIGFDGKLKRVVDLRVEVERGPRKFLEPPMMCIPYRDKHSNGIDPFFLVDNLGYITGAVDAETSTERAKNPYEENQKKVNAFAKLHHEILSGVTTPKATALLKFLDECTEERYRKSDDPFYDVFRPYWKEIVKASNIALMFEDGTFAFEDDTLAHCWNEYYHKIIAEENGNFYGECLVTGEKNALIARKHPAICGVQGAQTTGTGLVTSNLPSANWMEYDLNAYSSPVSVKAANIYREALKYLLLDPHHHVYLSDSNEHVIYWAESESSDASEVVASMTATGVYKYPSAADKKLFYAIIDAVKGYQSTVMLSDTAIDLSKKVCMLKIAPRGPRLIITDYQESPMLDIFKNVSDFLDTAKIQTKEDETYMPTYRDMSDAITPPSGKEPHNFSNELTAAVINRQLINPNTGSLLVQRIEADGIVDANRAALARCVLNNTAYSKGDLLVAPSQLDKDLHNTAYQFGRLFYYLETLQKKAIDGLVGGNRKILFSTAMKTPLKAYQMMWKKAQYHLKKISRDSGLDKWFIRQFMDIQLIMGQLPVTFNVTQRLWFVLGYYQQSVTKFEKN